jgi:hypothetical protein
MEQSQTLAHASPHEIELTPRRSQHCRSVLGLITHRSGPCQALCLDDFRVSGRQKSPVVSVSNNAQGGIVHHDHSPGAGVPLALSVSIPLTLFFFFFFRG